MSSPLWYVTGPTASGKTSVSLELAQLLDAEILNMDSMSVYRGMDIGTAKPTLIERARVPHHLFDLVEPDVDFSVAEYISSVQTVVNDLQSRKKKVLFVGGTPLYLKGLLRGFFEGPPADPVFRAQQIEDMNKGVDLHEKLGKIDPESARRLHPNDTRRLIRALEVFEKTGIPISVLQTQFEQSASFEQHRVFVLHWDVPSLNERINRRVDSMFEQGFCEEAALLFQRGISQTASQAVGYRELFAFFRGDISLQKAKDLIKLHSRQFAKRQRTWFRSLSECRSISLTDSRNPVEIAQQIAKMV
ncbi:MAG: tRNA (adenosine(37)-N6)-dimethylallyltransferase MiaA [Thermoguttaceae bacterium]